VKKLLAVLAVAVGVTGSSIAGAPSATAIPVHVRADGDVPGDARCVRINITLFGTPIGTGPEFICIA
jgi:hypothetical protein